ncbi:MAG: ADP-L-glycero-D-manno-heptose-6-epimerase [Alphaproteobacteria bacterium MarineAlpha9_Bin4]|nr:MAG: ADP-L-glycero-D-manno-heptose-6-epimerase [Alphaproteobacteria bacterium MarineAlpha9_Bin4]|tara:strand:+ start:483 stop:1457 length:975 start_codon:yes stop_codon:yes gene_type:complete
MIIVTGGAGFIGSNLINALIQKKRKVFLCDYPGLIVKSYFKKFENIEGIIEPVKLFEFIKNNNISIVFHLGAISATTYEDNNKLWVNNVLFSTKLWRLCINKKIRLIYASSAATYGDGSLGFEDNENINFLTKLKALNVYGWTKNQIDMRNVFFKESIGMTPPQWVGLKFFNVYGNNEYHKKNMISVVLKTYIQIKQNKETKLFKSYKKFYKDGEQKRDFIYVKDCINTLLWFLENKKVSGIFNIGTGKSNTFNDLVSSVYGCLNKNSNIKYIDMPKSIKRQYQYETKANLNKLRKVGYNKNFYSLKEGILDYIKILESSDTFS